MAAAPTTGAPLPTLASGAGDAEYNTNIATIEHGENNLFGSSYGTTGQIGGELGQGLANINTRLGEQVGPEYAKTGVLGGSLGLSQGTRTRALSARAGANTQSGLYGTERANTLLGFAQRGTALERGAREGRERIEDRARKAWEADQAARATAITRANTRYQNYVARNPVAAAPPGVANPPIAPGFLPQPGSTVPGGGYPAGNTTNVRIGPNTLMNRPPVRIPRPPIRRR